MSIYRRKSGRYAVLVDLEPTTTGLRRRKSIGTYRIRKDAERAERQAIEARDRGIDLSPKTVTVGELLDRYLCDREALGRGAKTLQEYRSYADRLVRPHSAESRSRSFGRRGSPNGATTCSPVAGSPSSVRYAHGSRRP